jgi:class 3 adenylate cyclase
VDARDAPGPEATDRYLLLADISGYTGFLGGVAEQHGEDFSNGLPDGYKVLGALIDLLIDGLPPGFELVKVEGDAVFAAAPATAVDGKGDKVLRDLGSTYRTFIQQRESMALTAKDDKCDACLVVNTLDLKAVVHRGFAVQQSVGRQPDVVGPAVNVAHRLLKNTVRDVIGYRPYILLSAPAAQNLGIADRGIEHQESYADVGTIDTRIIDLAELAAV